jgi:hypothetical protein
MHTAVAGFVQFEPSSAVAALLWVHLCSEDHSALLKHQQMPKAATAMNPALWIPFQPR